jgi:hypothetical protein
MRMHERIILRTTRDEPIWGTVLGTIWIGVVVYLALLVF